MTGCCVPGCSNSNKKGFLMRNFPSNPDRRKQWITSIGRPNWIPTAHSRVCEVHFTKDMWEKDRCDGKRKLKYNAVPMISPPPAPDDIPASWENCNKDNNVVNMLIASLTDEGNVEINYQYQLCSDNYIELEAKQPEDLLSMLASTSVKEETDWKKRCQELTQLLAKSESECKKLQDTLKKREELFNKIIRKSYQYKTNSEKRLKKLRAQNQIYNKLKSKLGEVFNEDQIRAFTNSRMSCREWSDETVKRAIQLRLTCGSVGYRQILDQNIPLPCERTLQRKMHSIIELDKDTEHIQANYQATKATNLLTDNEELH